MKLKKYAADSLLGVMKKFHNRKSLDIAFVSWTMVWHALMMRERMCALPGLSAKCLISRSLAQLLFKAYFAIVSWFVLIWCSAFHSFAKIEEWISWGVLYLLLYCKIPCTNTNYIYKVLLREREQIYIKSYIYNMHCWSWLGWASNASS